MSLALRSWCLRFRGLMAREAPSPALPLAPVQSLPASEVPPLCGERSSGTALGERRLSSASSEQRWADLEAQARGQVLSFLAQFRDFEETGVPKSAGAVPVASAAAAGAIGHKGAFDLQRMHDLMQALGRPLDGYQVVHVAGTKGKGSTASFLASILRAAGLRTGLYTSLRERIRGASGQPLQWQRLERLAGSSQGPILSVHEQHANTLTKFEVLTGLAYKYFAEDRVDVAVVEVGLGGILDATNVIPPASLALAVITAVGLDHVAALGGSLASIAHAKAGIMKAGKPVVIGPQFHAEALSELLAAASAMGASPVVTVTTQALPAPAPVPAPAPAPAAPASAPSCASDGAPPPHAPASSTQAVLPESAAAQGLPSSTALARCTGPPLLDSSGRRTQEVELSWWGPLPEKDQTGALTPSQASMPWGAAGGPFPRTWTLPGVRLRMLGQHMAENAAVAASAALLLRKCAPLVAKGLYPSDDAIRRGLEAAEVPGRFQMLSPGQAQHLGLEGADAVVLDGAHSGESAAALRTTLEQVFGGRGPCNLVLVVAMANDKEHLATLSALMRTGSGLALKMVVLTQINVAGSSARSMGAHDLAAQCHEAMQGVSPAQSEGELAHVPSTAIAPTLTEALEHARAALLDSSWSTGPRVVCFTGSLHLVGALLQNLPSME